MAGRLALNSEAKVKDLSLDTVHRDILDLMIPAWQPRSE